jgi:sodium transport system permease protein
MPMRNIGVVYRKELREALRDRRTLISSFLVPLLLFPLLTAGFGAVSVYIIGEARRESPPVMILGGNDSPHALQQIRQTEKIRIVPTAPDWKKQIADKEVRAAVEIPAGFESDVEQQKPATVKIYVYKNEMKSEIAAERLEKTLKKFGEGIVGERLAASNLSASVLKPFEVQQENVVSEEKAWAEILGGMIGYMVVLLCLTGGMYPAMDLTAGEKERGTMETILSSPIARTDLVLGKFLLVLTASLVTAVLSVTSMGTSFAALNHFHLFTVSGQGENTAMMLHLTPLATLSIFIMALPLAVFFSACLMAISIFAKSYKEAQTYISPLMILVIVPAVSAMLPGAELNAKMALIPIFNASLLCKELVAGTYHWQYIVIIFLSTSVYAAAALFLAVKMFQREDVLFRS